MVAPVATTFSAPVSIVSRIARSLSLAEKRFEQNRSTAHDNTGLCLFVGAANAPLESFVPCTAAATGVPYDIDEFVKIGERTWNLEKLWNIRAGLTKADDTLPKRLLNDAHKKGPSAGVTVDLNAMLPIYYAERGWDGEGSRPEAGRKILDSRRTPPANVSPHSTPHPHSHP